ncbi:MAG TPA: ABC transporter substrate-binding protein [Dongiaceae bacterium]|nr:ABC transporter substrate-binding protein [Dongiaceae bacterium]
MKDYQIHLMDELRAGRMSRRELLRCASVAGISLAAFGPSIGARPARADTPKRGGTIRLAAQIPGKDPEPVTASNAGEVFTYQPSLEYLCYPREDWTLDPRLATSWKADPDPKTWTFAIRQGVKWHDGSPLTADDVVATFQRLLDPKVGSSAGSIYHGVLSFGNVEKVGDSDVRFHLDKPFVDFPYLVSGFAYQSAILPKNYQMGSFTKGGIGTGPFILKEYIPHQHAIYAANPSYWVQGLPYLEGLRIAYYADESATVLAMQAGDVDIYPVVPLKGAEPVLANPNFKILRHASADYRSVHMRVDQAPFKDKRLRQAVAYCIDRDALVKSLFNGAATIANDHSFAPVYVDTQLANQDIPQRKQDYAKAKALLAEAGVNGFDVTLTTEQLLEMPQFAVAIREYCKPAGINIKLDIMPTNQYYGAGDNQPWLVVPMGMTDWAARGTVAQAIIPEFPTGALWNSAHWSDPQFDKLFADYNAELDHQKRQKLALELARIQHEEVPVMICYWISAQRATTKAVQGFPAAPDNFLDLRATWLSS